MLLREIIPLTPVEKARGLALVAVIACFAVNASAQTRLSSPQLPTLNSAITGPFALIKLRDINSSRDHGNTVTTGIANAIADCGQTISCSILVPPSYGNTELTPGYSYDPSNANAAATTSGNITIFDRRFGDARMAVNPAGVNVGLITTPNGWVYNYYSKAKPNADLTTFYILQNSLDGGKNQQNSALSYADKTQWTPMLLKDNSYTPGQHLTAGVTTLSAGTGNVIGVSDHVYCYGGLNAQGDTGCLAQNNSMLQGSVEYAGTLSGTPAAAATTLTVVPTQGALTQGARRFLARTNAGTLSAGSISNIATGSYAMTTLTGKGTSWPVSKVIAQLGTSVSAPGAATVTPASFTTGSLSLITTSTLVCIADPNSFEMVYPSAVSATGFTATFNKIHTSASTISSGGVCGYVLDLTADDVTSSTFTTHAQTITGTLHFAWPLVASTSATSAGLWVAGGGAYQQLMSRWNATSANGYVMYPFAEVVSVQKSGGLSNTLSLSPNNVSWTAGDVVAEFLYPAFDVHAGNNVVEAYYPNLAPNAHNFSFNYNSPLQGSDTMLTLANNAPLSFYQVNGGPFASPFGIHVQGQTKYGLFFDRPSDQWTLGVGCSGSCTATQNVFAAANSLYYDFLQYDESNARWSIGAGSNAVHYTLGASRLYTPFSNLYASADSAGVGYLSVQSLRSGVATNTDLSGELSLSAVTSATYTFLGSYGVHPECLVKPQVDMGSNNRHWVTYSGTTSFTINFASAITGSVSYSCAARN